MRRWRRRTLPPDLPGSTIRAARLNGRGRDGNGCGPRAMTTNNQYLGQWERAIEDEIACTVCPIRLIERGSRVEGHRVNRLV